MVSPAHLTLFISTTLFSSCLLIHVGSFLVGGALNGMGSIDWFKSSLFQMFQVFSIRSFTEKPNRMAICQMRQNKSFVKEKFCVTRYGVAKTRKNSNFLSSFLQTSLIIIITIIIIIIYLVLFT